MQVEHFDVTARRRRLTRRQHLGAPATGVEAVAGDLVGLHATDPATVYLSLQQRLDGFRVGDLDEALYERRTLHRLLGMRRTVFVVPLDLAAVIDASCTKVLVPGERRRTIQLIAAEGIERADELLDAACAATLRAIEAGEPLPARALTSVVTELQQQVLLAEGKPYEARSSITNRVLLQLSIEGHIVRTRPLGTWLSSQYRWTTMEGWFGQRPDTLTHEVARAELVRRWLGTYGPGTTTDIAWWAKWPKGHVVAALAAIGAVEVTVEPAPGAAPAPAWMLADDGGDAESEHTPVVALLPALDPAMMGWKQRDWYLGDHAGELFDRNGNAGPTVIVDGAAVGAWGQRAGGRVVTELFEPVDATARRHVAEAADRLTEWLGGTRVMPRFPSPAQSRLAADG